MAAEVETQLVAHLVPARRNRLEALLRNATIERLTIALVVAGALWRTVRYAMGFPIWGDEAFVATDFVTRKYAEMIQPTIWGQIVPLVFMWAELAISQVLGLSEWALRLLPFLAGIASLLLFWWFARDLLPRRPAMLAIGIFAASIYLVRHAAEVKPYSTDLLVALVLLMLAWRVHTKPGSIAGWLLLIAFGAAAVWCSYPALFVLATIGVLLAWQTWRQLSGPRAVSVAGSDRAHAHRLLAGTLSYALVVGGSFIAMYVFYARPHAQNAARLTEISMWAQTFPPLIQIWKLPVWFFAIHTGNMLAYPLGGKAPGSIVTFVLVLVGLVQLWRRQRYLLWLLLGPLVFTFCAAAMKAYPYGGSARTSLYMAPAFCLLAGVGLSAAFQKLARIRPRVAAAPAHGRLRLLIQFAAAVLIIIPLAGSAIDIGMPYKSESVYLSWNAVQTVLQRTRPGDRWVVFNAKDKVDYAPWLGDWRGTGAQFFFDVARFHPVPLAWSPPPETVTPDAGGRVWLLAYRGWKIAFPEEQLAAYLATLEQRLGPGQQERFHIKEKKGQIEALDVYLFAPDRER